MTLEEYLKKKYTKYTARTHLTYIQQYLKVTRAKAKEATIQDIITYIGTIRKKNNSPGYLINNLQALKKYYDWLVDTKQRKDHPCKYLKLKDKQNKHIQLQDLFKEEELELLLEKEEKYPHLKTRNQIIISLLIYQGLTTGDIVQLRVNDIELEKGTIFIKAKSQSNSRTLSLRPNQVMLLYKYIKEDRLKLLSKYKKMKDTEALLLTNRGTAEKGEGIEYLLSTFKHLFPDRKLNTKTIRMSVIANLLKQGKDLRLVQVFAGHKSPSTTEKYKQSQVEELQNEINKYHPLG